MNPRYRKLCFCVGLLFSILHADTYILKEIDGSQKIAQDMLTDSENGCYIEIIKQDGGEMLSGVSFCNRLIGIIKDSKIENVGSTMMMCSPKDMQNEARLLSILMKSEIERSKNFVIIKSKKGTALFERK